MILSRPVWLTALLAISLTGMGAQTRDSRTMVIRDHLRKAAGYLKANDPAEAIKEFQAVLALDPKNADAYTNLGAVAFFRRDYEQAARYLHSALAIDPSVAKTQALLGMCEKRMGDPDAVVLLERSFPALKEKSIQIQVGLELANLYYQRGNLDRAASIMRSLVDLDPDNVGVLYMAQRIYSELADDTLNKLTILAPNSALMQQVIAERLINEGDLKGATDHFRKALAIDPHLPGVHYELAEAILEAAPNNAQAQADSEKELETAVQSDGERAGTECMFGRIALRRSDLDSAYVHYTRALSVDPGNTEAQIALGRLLVTTEKPREAEKYLRMAVQSDPLNEEAHYRLALVCRKLQLSEESDKELRLFREIKQTKKVLRELYGQMNKKPPGQEEQLPDDVEP